MGKWILATENMPPRDRELLCIFDATPSEVWHASLNDDGKYRGTCLDSEVLQELHGDLICWKFWPKSPFCDGA